jgi:hypothetical protein
MIKRHLLPLNLQLFAQDPPVPTDPPTDPPKPLDQTERQELISLRKTAAITAAGIMDPQDVANMQTRLAGLEDPAAISEKIDAILLDLKLLKFQEAVDPSPGNFPRQDPSPKSWDQLGREMFWRIKGKKL